MTITYSTQNTLKNGLRRLSKQVSRNAIASITATGGAVSTITDGGSTYTLHTFNSVGSNTFTVVSGAGTVDYFMVAAGGGGGGSGGVGGGGGAGGLLTGNIAVTTQAYSVSIGTGGGGGNNTNSGSTYGANGGNTTAFGLTAVGGGGGASVQNANENGRGSTGGSGGGSDRTTLGGINTSGQGYAGGGGAKTGNLGAGGGGGAGGAGANGTGTTGGAGGTGVTSTFSGVSTGYAGGGGGAIFNQASGRGVGTQGGGNGRSYTTEAGSAGTDGTGGGGGGAVFNGGSAGYKGGNGILMVRYPASVANVRRTGTAASITPITFSAYNSANYSTAKAKFGAGSLDLEASNKVLYYSNYSSSGTGGGWPTGTGDFCIEGWTWIPSGRAAGTGDPISFNVSGGLGVRFGAGYNSGGVNYISIWARGQADLDYAAFTWPTNAWCHWAVQRKSASISIWANGVKLSSQPNASFGSAASRNFAAGTAQLTIGSYDNGGGTDETVKASMDEICVSNSWRYDDSQSSYQVPSAAFTVDQYTCLLIHADSSLTTAAT